MKQKEKAEKFAKKILGFSMKKLPFEWRKIMSIYFQRNYSLFFTTHDIADFTNVSTSTTYRLNRDFDVLMKQPWFSERYNLLDQFMKSE